MEELEKNLGAQDHANIQDFFATIVGDGFSHITPAKQKCTALKCMLVG